MSHNDDTSNTNLKYYRFCYVYCATLQGSLDWVETERRPRPASLLRVICVLSILDGYCSTVQDLLDWFEVDLGFTKLHLFR